MPIHRIAMTRRIASPPLTDGFHKAVVDNIADGVYYVDRSRTITYWNRGAERITGYPAASVVGKPCFANILAHVDDRGKRPVPHQLPPGSDNPRR